MLFTDIVGSSEIAVELGDRRWRHLQSLHNSLVRQALRRFGGREVDTAGDGFFATFDTPAAGVRCASAIVKDLREFGLAVRAGVHIGETDLAGEKVGGIAVSTAARVAAIAGPGQVLVTETIVQLAAGSRLEFAELGVRELRGVPGRWELFSLVAVDGDPIEPPLDPQEATEHRLRAGSTVEGRSRSKIFVSAALAGVVAVAAVVIALGRDPRSDGARSHIVGPTDRPVVVLSARSGAVLSRPVIPSVYEGPGASDFGSGGPIALTSPKGASAQSFAWIISGVEGSHSETLYQVDQSDYAVTGTIPELTGCDPAPGCLAELAGKLWLLNAGPGLVEGPNVVSARPIDLATSTWARSIRVAASSIYSVRGLAAGAGSLWIADGSSDNVYRVDPNTSQSRTYALKGSVSDIAFGGRYLWVLDNIYGRLTRIDPVSHEIRWISLSGQLSSLTFGAGHVWVTDQTDNQVWSMTKDLTRLSRTPVGKSPVDVAYGDGAIWVANSGDGTVSKIDPITGLQIAAPYPVGIQPQALAAAGGRVWVAGDVLRSTT
jgi:DNA-binding beta-propeller fold protein YncE